MNVGIVTTWMERGAAYVSKNFADVIGERRRVLIYARGGETIGRGDPVWDGPHVTWAPRLGVVRGAGVYKFNYGHFTRWIEREKIDVVFFNEERNQQTVHLANQLGCRTGAYVDYYTRETVPFFRTYDFLVCNTRRHYSVFADHPNCVYIPWGTDVELFRPQSRTRDPHVRFFHSAGMSPHRKGTDLLVRAFKRVSDPARLIIHTQVGLERCGLNKPEWQDPRIEIVHQTVGAPGLYHRGDVYVYPSRLDGIGLTICEALACGLPVVTTDCQPMNEFVKHGRTGRVVRVAHSEPRHDNYYWPMVTPCEKDLTAQMQYYIDHRDNIAIHGAAARAAAETSFCWRINARAIHGVLDGLDIRTARRRPTLSQKTRWLFLGLRDRCQHDGMALARRVRRRLRST